MRKNLKILPNKKYRRGIRKKQKNIQKECEVPWCKRSWAQVKINLIL